MNFRHLLRMSRMARRPPSWQKVVLVFSVIGICIVLASFEWFFGWPEWATVNSNARGRFPRN
ncbi:lipoyl synthase [Rhodobacterales bacterium HTCC2150]|jgi:hypothetical protein|nr:lipoyl synthase [Rhodobacterales bacterium HTCC2150] [Rhodobacteraceae bacterium HTCC2150]